MMSSSFILLRDVMLGRTIAKSPGPCIVVEAKKGPLSLVNDNRSLRARHWRVILAAQLVALGAVRFLARLSSAVLRGTAFIVREHQINHREEDVVGKAGPLFRPESQ